MKCVYTLFSKSGLLKNIGSYILLFTIFLFLISAILFHKYGYNLLEDDIQEIIEEKKEKNELDNLNIQNTIDTNDKKEKNLIINKTKKSKYKKKIKKKKKHLSKEIEIKSNLSGDSKSISKIDIKNSKGIITVQNKQLNTSPNYNDYEYNSLSYQEATKLDKRSFIGYYFSLIKVKQPIIFSFCPFKDYNSFIIKIDLFFLSFCIYSFINCLFFDESRIHKIYTDESVYNFNYLIPYITYSFIISHTIFTTIKYFSLSERNIGEIKDAKTMSELSDKEYQAKRCIKIKYTCFFCLSIIFLIFFWYYLSSFGAVYQNTQIYLIKNILISFSFSLLYPFIVNLFPSIFRLYSLKGYNKEKLKLIRIFLIKYILVFWYTAPNEDK